MNKLTLTIMCCEIFVRLLLAHIIGDFICQTDEYCEKKFRFGLRSRHIYLHAVTIIGLSWLVLWSWSAWWVSVLIGLSHLVIDSIKKSNRLIPFLIDQFAHIAVLVFISVLVVRNDMYGVICCNNRYILCVLVGILNAKPTNILVKLLLKEYSVNPAGTDCKDTNADRVKSGKLIGNIERWLIIIFILCDQYEAIGFLIAAKSIIRYKEGDTQKTEYVLAGTLLSVFIAVVSGLLLKVLSF